MASGVVDAVDELTHVRGEMILGRHFGRSGNGRFPVTDHRMVNVNDCIQTTQSEYMKTIGLGNFSSKTLCTKNTFIY